MSKSTSLSGISLFCKHLPSEHSQLTTNMILAYMDSRLQLKCIIFRLFS